MYDCLCHFHFHYLSGIASDVTPPQWGSFADQGLIEFGMFKDIEYGIEQFPLFALIGIGGGLLGALFNYLNVTLYKYATHRLIL